MNACQNLRLQEWIMIGKQSGKIRDPQTVMLVYCMDERLVLPLIINIVEGRMEEQAAQIFLENVINFGTEGSGEIPFLS